MDATIVIPVCDQIAYTKQCLTSLNAAGCPDTMIVIVDNASTDGTAEFLAQRTGLRVIRNPENRACAAAWNQGFQTVKTKWTVFLNNDVLLTPGWLEQLIAFAEKNGVDIVSPATGEGDLDYDLEVYARNFTNKMKSVRRRGTAQGPCFMVARAVFEKIGGFDENFRKGGNEDKDFFWRARDAGFKLCVCGCSFIHHFGSVTQRAMAVVNGSTRAETIGYFRAKWHLNWPRRRWMRLQNHAHDSLHIFTELLLHGHTLRERHEDERIFHR